MATTKVSALTEITSTTGSEELLINDGGTSKKIQVSNLPDTDTTYSNFAGTTAGLVPTSTTGDDTKFLRADGTWVVPTDTDTNTTYTSSDFTHNSLSGVTANEHIDWTTDQGATNIHAGNYTDTDTGITDVVDDTTPQLGGDLDFQTHKATSFTSTGIDDNATSTAITIDSSENVGIGVTPNSDWRAAWTVLQLGGRTSLSDQAEGSEYTVLANNARRSAAGVETYQETGYANKMWMGAESGIVFNVAPSGTADAAITWTTVAQFYKGAYNGVFETGTFSTTGATPGMMHDSVTGGPSGGISVSGTTTGFKYNMRFYNPNGQVGYIKTEGTATLYATSSDYRLKENVVPMTGSIDRLKELKPSRFNFKADTETTVDGFLAHEAGEVVPECVGGTKDAMMDEEYEVTPAVMDGETVVTEAVMGTRSVPDYQGIDQSKLSPLTISALQEAITLIEQLTARVTELEKA